MAWYAKAALFALKTAAEPALREVGKKIGEAVGKRVGRKVDPNAPPATDKKPTTENPNAVSEEERTP